MGRRLHETAFRRVHAYIVQHTSRVHEKIIRRDGYAGVISTRLYNGDVKDGQCIATIQQSFIFCHEHRFDISYTEIPVLNQALDKLDEKDELNNKLLQQCMLNDKQIKILSKIEATGDKNYKKYNDEIYNPYVKGLVSDFEKRQEDKQFSYPHYIPRKFFVTVADIMPNLKKKYWHGPGGIWLDNEITEDKLSKIAEVVINILNQTQEPNAAKNAYLRISLITHTEILLTK
jgi:hypothetical protein